MRLTGGATDSKGLGQAVRPKDTKSNKIQRYSDAVLIEAAMAVSTVLVITTIITTIQTRGRYGPILRGIAQQVPDKHVHKTS